MASMDVVSMTFDTGDSKESVLPARAQGQSTVFRRCQWIDEMPVSDTSGQPSSLTVLKARPDELDHRNPEHKPEMIRWVSTALLRSLSMSMGHDFGHVRLRADVSFMCR